MMIGQNKNKAVFIAGPTASGKSAFALAVAEQLNGVIINADSMQVYEDLRIISARPGKADERRVPHRLYGCVRGDENWSVAAWMQAAEAEVKRVWEQGQIPVLTGGTGLYFKALEQGLAPIPDIPADIREEGQARIKAIGLDAFYEEVKNLDPASVARLNPRDRHRLLRVWEVITATRTPLSIWQSQKHKGPLARQGVALTRIAAAPARDWLYAQCDARVHEMIEQGALDEIARVLALGLAPERPLMKALGVPELGAYLRDELCLEDAMALLQRNTRRYAKRQLTWFRNQCDHWECRVEKFNVSNIKNIFS